MREACSESRSREAALPPFGSRLQSSPTLFLFGVPAVALWGEIDEPMFLALMFRQSVTGRQHQR